MSENKNKNKKEIEVFKGDGNDLDISPVYDHIKSDHIPGDNKTKKDIVIPKKSSSDK